mmetsp:Transcript_13771/g.31203  ORF Transcript_13771/g.31203 Transcript_13771/m.31203 type:complete len:268 (-) Transcript_13771:105-908(-)|eukprot:CAMPEP_0197901138 /NCGR_PEP_ID=MMETSP1439-20131203/50779_1 /TAXON_ID=66791 /ORGANISM="Gonyaulax spinifera, Strain CCMP409" /LENGTH=267 /DNA_ID=CAMNT_0043522097 /DNA_START=126 /DNA_END=929 /DNA_ORIENTATION=+
MDSAMMAAIAAHQAELKKKAEEASKKKKKKKGGGPGGFHAFDSFDAKASQAVAHGKRPREEAADSDSEKEEEDEEGQKKIPPVDWSTTPDEIQTRDQVESAQPAGCFVAHFILFVMGRWRKCLDDKILPQDGWEKLSDTMRAIYESEASLRETQEMLSPLIRQLEKAQVDSEVMMHLDKMVGLAAEREYKEALGHYVEITIGRKKWNNAVMFGEAKHNKGFNARRVKRDEDNKFDSDETVKKYVQALRRVMNFAQLIRPNDDVSKHM